LNDIPLGALFGILLALIALSGFFSGSETALMTLNRYRLRHLVKSGHRGARLAARLLERPDRLIGLILLGNNFVNILASALSTVIALRLWGEAGIAVATGLLTLVILIFAEVTPKTLATLHPEPVAFFASHVYTPLLKLFYPLVWVVNALANNVLRALRVSPEHRGQDALSSEELRTVVNEAGSLIPKRHQTMLLNILDLEKVTVNDVMVPRNEVIGIDIDDDWDNVVQQISHSPFGRVPVYREDIDNAVGFLHLRKLISPQGRLELRREHMEKHIREPYFIPEETPLTVQLLNFQRLRRRMGLVVDEYGDILGLVTIEDILEEIVGEFDTDPLSEQRDLRAQDDGSYIADGSTPLRNLNRALGWELESDSGGPKTLNGLILEQLEYIPATGANFHFNGHPIEVLETRGNAVRKVLIRPRADAAQSADANGGASTDQDRGSGFGDERS